MGLFKKKSSKVEESKEYEETLVAEGQDTPPEAGEPDLLAPSETAPDEGVDLSNEPVPASEPETAPEWTPSPPEPEPEPDFSAELAPYVRREGLALVLNEKNFDRPSKLDREGKVTSSPRTALREKAWYPAHESSIGAIRRSVDRITVKPVPSAGKWLRAHFRSAPETRREVVPANILGKRIVFETEGGFVVEATYREGSELRRKFYLADSKGGRTKALSAIQSGKFAQAHVVTEQTIQELGRPRGGHLPWPPGKVNTYEITNQWDVVEIEGIGDKFTRRLHELGILTTDQLRLMNATVIGNNIGAQPAVVGTWQHMAELMIVPGIGKQYAEALVRVGVTGVDALKKEKPKDLAKRINTLLDSQRVPIIGTHIRSPRAKSWVLAARKMKKTLQPFPRVEA